MRYQDFNDDEFNLARLAKKAGYFALCGAVGGALAGVAVFGIAAAGAPAAIVSILGIALAATFTYGVNLLIRLVTNSCFEPPYPSTLSVIKIEPTLAQRQAETQRLLTVLEEVGIIGRSYSGRAATTTAPVVFEANRPLAIVSNLGDSVALIKPQAVRNASIELN